MCMLSHFSRVCLWPHRCVYIKIMYVGIRTICRFRHPLGISEHTPVDKKTTVYVWEKKNNANRHMFYINTMLCCVLSHVWLSVTLWTVALQAPLTMEFYRQEYWSEFPFPPPGDLPSPGIEQTSPALQWILYRYNSLLLLSHLGSPYIYIHYI